MSKEVFPNGEPAHPFDTSSLFRRQLDLAIAAVTLEEQHAIEALDPEKPHNEPPLCEIRTLLDGMAFNAGLTFAEYQAVRDTYGNETLSILELLASDVAKTPEDAHTLLSHQLDVRTEQTTDALRTAVNTKPLYRRHTRGGRLLDSDDRHRAYQRSRHIGKRAVVAMFQRYLKSQGEK